MEAAFESIHRLTVEDIFQMLEAGVLSGDERLELVDGILLDVAHAGEPHSEAVAWLNEHFTRAAGEAWQVRVQDTLFVPRGFRSPDLMLVAREPGREQLTTALLVVEISRTSRARDEAKAVDYAQAGVPEYWRVDLETAEVVVRRHPLGDGYREMSRHGRGETVEPLVAAPALDVAALLGAA